MSVWRDIRGIALLLALFPASAGPAASVLAAGRETSADNGRPGFCWVARGQNPSLWSTVEDVFRQELSPDAPAPHEMTYRYKYVLSIGVCGDHALVLIGRRAGMSDPPELDPVRAYSYDVRTSRKSKVAPDNDFLSWRYVGPARFEPSAIPDIVFTHDDCVECEPVEQLSSFRFDSKDNVWRVRAWPRGGTGLFIGGAVREAPPHMRIAECLYSTRDANGDRIDDIAIWCRERDVISGAETDNLILYTMQGGIPAASVPGEALAQEIKAWSCRDTPGSPLCSRERDTLGTRRKGAR